MTNIVQPYSNFSRGQADHDLNGRFELPIYNTSANIFRNAISNFKGNLIYSSGFESMFELFDCVFAEFKFNNQQQYIIFLYQNKMRFASFDEDGNFGLVLDSGGVNPLEVTTPYTLAQCREVDYTQNDDVMYFTHKSHAPRKLTRLSANSFSFGTYARTADPFINLEAVKNITAITQANPANVTIAAHGYVTGDKVYITNVGGMEQVNEQIFTITRVGANDFTLDGINSTSYDAYTAGGDCQRLKSTAITNITQANPAVVTSAAHTLSTGDIVTIFGVIGMTQVNGLTFTVDVINSSSFSLRGIDSTAYTAYSSAGRVRELEDYPAKCRFYKGRLYYANTTLKVTTIFASVSGQYDNFTKTPVDDASALIFTVTDIAQPIEWLFPGDNSLIVGATDGIVAVNGGSVGAAITAATVASKPTTAPPCNSTFPVSKDGLIFYVGSDGRNVYYFQYDLLTESFTAKDANITSYDITKGGISKIRVKKDKNDLIFALRGSEDLISCNFSLEEKINGWHERTTEGTILDEAVITDNEGKATFFALVLRNGSYFVEQQAPYLEFVKRHEFLEDYDYGDEDGATQAKSFDDDAYYTMIAEQMKECIFLDGSLSVSNLRQENLVFTPTGGTVGSATGYITAASAVFSSGDVDKHIVYKTETGYERGRFVITSYTSTTVVQVTELVETSTNIWSGEWYLSFHELTGLDQYIGSQIGLVADGKYLGDFFIEATTLDLEQQYTSVVVGYRYPMLVKTFTLGLQIQAANTQVTTKLANNVSIRVTASAGGKVGTTPYRLERIQDASSNDQNYLPPMPMDGTKNVPFSDDAEIDKALWIVQDEPLPFTATAFIPRANHSVVSP